MKAKKLARGRWIFLSASFVFLLASFFLFLNPSLAEEEEVQLQRDEKGAVVQQDLHLDIPEDQKIIRVASNVIRPQDHDKYVDEKISRLAKLLEDYERRLAELEKKVNVS